MKKQGLLIIVILVVVAVISVAVGTTVTNSKAQRKCEQYNAYLSGHAYNGFDSTTTASHGIVDYYYTMTLNEDSTCHIHFKAVRHDDNSIFSKNGTTEFDINDLSWSVRECEDGYALVLSGDWDWQGWSAAEINREIEIIDNGEDIAKKGVRSGYYEFNFEEVN